MARKRKHSVTCPSKTYSGSPSKLRKIVNIGVKDNINHLNSTLIDQKDNSHKKKRISNHKSQNFGKEKSEDNKYIHVHSSIGNGRTPPITKEKKISVSNKGQTDNSSKCSVKTFKKKKQGNCMKHKKQDKSQVWKTKHKKLTPTIYREGSDKHKAMNEESKFFLPAKPQDISANWKALQKVCNLKRKHWPPAQNQDNLHRSATQQTEEKVWFDDVDEVLIQSSRTKTPVEVTNAREWDSEHNSLVKTDAYSGVTKAVAMDCEMVGVGAGGLDSVLARVSIVNHFGQCIYDQIVKPQEKVVDYRTPFSGLRPGDLYNGEEFRDVQKQVHDLIKGRILVGHALHNDLKVLFLDHPRKTIRDTSKYKPFRKLFQGRTPSLKKLSDRILGVQVQQGEHNSIQDAQAAMRLYTMYRKTWEKEIKLKRMDTNKTHQKRKKNKSKQADIDNAKVLSDSETG